MSEVLSALGQSASNACIFFRRILQFAWSHPSLENLKYFSMVGALLRFASE